MPPRIEPIGWVLQADNGRYLGTDGEEWTLNLDEAMVWDNHDDACADVPEDASVAVVPIYGVDRAKMTGRAR